MNCSVLRALLTSVAIANGTSYKTDWLSVWRLEYSCLTLKVEKRCGSGTNLNKAAVVVFLSSLRL